VCGVAVVDTLLSKLDHGIHDPVSLDLNARGSVGKRRRTLGAIEEEAVTTIQSVSPTSWLCLATYGNPLKLIPRYE
jgi:hypothetical protein